MYGHWRPPVSMPLLTLNVLGPLNTSDLVSMVSFTFTMRRHLIQVASAPFTSFHLAKFAWLLFADPCVCATHGNEVKRRIYGRWVFLPTLRKFCVWLRCHALHTEVSERKSTKLCQMERCKWRSPILSRLWTKVHEILVQCRRPSCFPKPLQVICVVFRSEYIRH